MMPGKEHTGICRKWVCHRRKKQRSVLHGYGRWSIVAPRISKPRGVIFRSTRVSLLPYESMVLGTRGISPAVG
jgi:hypothetical protein